MKGAWSVLRSSKSEDGHREGHHAVGSDEHTLFYNLEYLSG